MNRAWAVLWLIACGASPETDVSDTDGHSEDTDSDTDLDTDPVAPPGHVDCAAPLPSPTQRIVPGVRGYHGLAFDAEGWMVGSDGTSLVRADDTGHTQLLVPNVGSVEKYNLVNSIEALPSFPKSESAINPGGFLIRASTAI